MARLQDCNGCMQGDHSRHRRVVRGVPKGVIGGVVCDCKGDCGERNKDWAERLMRETYGPAATREEPRWACGTTSRRER